MNNYNTTVAMPENSNDKDDKQTSTEGQRDSSKEQESTHEQSSASLQEQRALGSLAAQSVVGKTVGQKPAPRNESYWVDGIRFSTREQALDYKQNL